MLYIAILRATMGEPIIWKNNNYKNNKNKSK